MTSEPKILELLRRSGDPAADQALAAGLGVVSPHLQAELVEILLRRAKEPGLAALPESFDKLEPLAQSLVIANSARLFGTLRSTLRGSSLQMRLNTLEIIRRSQNPRLSFLAAAAMHDGSTQIRSEAAQTLFQLTELHCRALAETTEALRDVVEHDASVTYAVIQTLRLLTEEREQLLGAIREALGSFESHLRLDVLRAAMCMADELEPALFEQGSLSRGKLTTALLEVFSSQPAPHLAPFAYIALAYPDLRKRVVSVLSHLRDARFFAEFIRCSWLARDGRIGRNLQAIRSMDWLEHESDAAFALPPDVAAMAPSWIVQLGIPNERKTALLANLLLLDNPAANRAAAWALARIPTPGSTQALRSLLDGENAELRRIAEGELAHRQRGEGHRPLSARANRPPEWSAILDQTGLAEDFEDFWLHFDRVPPELAAAGGAYALKYIPGFASQVQLKLGAAQPLDRLRALNLLADLRLAAHFSRDVFNAANDPAAEVRAAAMRGLSQVAEATSRRILERAMHDDAPAVQAAAIYALDEMAAPRRSELILPKTRHEDPDVRGAAVRAMLRMHVPQAAVALAAMLHDQRPEHRCKALWIADELELIAISHRISQLAAKDPDMRIARIAQHVGRRLARLGQGDAAGKGSGRSEAPQFGRTPAPRRETPAVDPARPVSPGRAGR